jgi:hypothetical protein
MVAVVKIHTEWLQTRLSPLKDAAIASQQSLPSYFCAASSAGMTDF